MHNCWIALDSVGDGHSDSPGFNAKYGTYTLLNSKTNQTIDCHLDHVALAENSVRMEERGLTILVEKCRRIGVMIKSITSDWYVQIRSYLTKDHPDILHQFDIWHIGKGIKKALFKESKSKGCEKLGMWIKVVINHFWCCCASGNRDPLELREKWISILFHIKKQAYVGRTLKI